MIPIFYVINSSLNGMKFGKDGDGNYGYYGADGSLIPFKSGGYKLILNDKNVRSLTLTSTVPNNITEGIIVAITSAGSGYNRAPIVTGEAIVSSETLFEINQTGGSGVMLGVKVLKCVLKPNATFTTSGVPEEISSSHVNLLFAK